MRTIFLVRCSMCRKMMPNVVDCFGYQSRAWTSPPQKYLQSLAFEVSTTHANVLNYNTFSL